MSGAGPQPQILGEERLYKGFAQLDRYSVEVPWRGRIVPMVREVHYHGHGAAVFPVDPARRTGILIRQFRLAPWIDGGDGWIWEIPAGLLEGDPPERCVEKEAWEEAGIVIGTPESLGSCMTSPGIIRERLHLFWASYGTPPTSSIGGLDEEAEMIEICELAMNDIWRMVDRGEIEDAKSAMTIFRLRTRRPDLFAV